MCMCINIYIPQLHPLRGPRNSNNATVIKHTCTQILASNVIPTKRIQDSVEKWADPRTNSERVEDKLRTSSCGQKQRHVQRDGDMS